MHRQTAIALDPNLTIEAITRDENFIRTVARGAGPGTCPGWHVTSVAEIRALGRRAVAIGGDLASVDEIAPMIRAVDEGLGPVDILVNNAGVNQVEPSVAVTADTWDWLLAVNLRAPFLLAQAAAMGMIERGHGKMINIGRTSAGAVMPSTPPMAPQRAGWRRCQRYWRSNGDRPVFRSIRSAPGRRGRT